MYAQSRIRPKSWDAEKFLEFFDTNESPNLGQTNRPDDSQ